jgi:hypothetical protein
MSLQASAASLNASEQWLVHQCEAFYRPRRAGLDIAAAQARRSLDSKSAAWHMQTLTPLLHKVPAGSDAYVSVAYVLARRGVEVDKNVSRLLIPVQHPEWVARHDLAFPAGVILRAGDVYRRYPNGAILRTLLSLRTDQAGETVLVDTCVDLFRHYPTTVLSQAATTTGDLQALAGSLQTAGEDTVPVLRDLAGSPDTTVSRAARYCLRRFPPALPVNSSQQHRSHPQRRRTMAHTKPARQNRTPQIPLPE